MHIFFFNFQNFQSHVLTGQPHLHSNMVRQGLNTPLGQSLALASSQMQQSNPCFEWFEWLNSNKKLIAFNLFCGTGSGTLFAYILDMILESNYVTSY